MIKVVVRRRSTDQDESGRQKLMDQRFFSDRVAMATVLNPVNQVQKGTIKRSRMIFADQNS